MPAVSFIRALIVLHRTYRRRDARTRLHALVRFLTCPFLRVVRHVPRGAALLEIGAGHGLFARLARAHGARRAVAVEPDLRKVQPVEGVDVIAGFDECVRGAFDCVAVIDVFYKVPLAEWDALLARIAARLRPGGLLIVKEQDPTARVKNAWNRVQERLVSWAGLTLGTSFSYEAPAAFAARLRRHGFEPQPPRRIDLGYPHPHILYLAYHQG
jgi:SAM-dependent methyltransferase